MSVTSRISYEAVYSYSGDGQFVGDVLKTIDVAAQEALSLGVNTGFADWAEVFAESGEHRVEFRVPTNTVPGHE